MEEILPIVCVDTVRTRNVEIYGNFRERSALKAERDLAGIKPLFEQKAAS